MKLSDICKNYFSGFYEASNYKNNDKKTNTLAALKILSYFTVIIPLGFGAIYGAASLYGRISKKKSLSPQDKSVDNQAKIKINQKDEPTLLSTGQINKGPLKLESTVRAAPWKYYQEEPSPLPENWEKHQAEQDIIVDYNGDIVDIPKGNTYFTYEGKVAIGWHGTYNPPGDMG